jgi:hypothetical protein
MKLDVLDGRTSSTRRPFASKRTIKISASIATTLWIKTAKQPRSYARPVPPKNCDPQHNICTVGYRDFNPFVVPLNDCETGGLLGSDDE